MKSDYLYTCLMSRHFISWVVTNGTAGTARLFGVNVRTVNFWKAGHSKPSVKTAKRIAELSGLTLEQIYQ